jgi:hypothetical protein
MDMRVQWAELRSGHSPRQKEGAARTSGFIHRLPILLDNDSAPFNLSLIKCKSLVSFWLQVHLSQMKDSSARCTLVRRSSLNLENAARRQGIDMSTNFAQCCAFEIKWKMAGGLGQ